MKLATFRSGGLEKIGMVHSDDSRLFDLAKAAKRDGKADPVFAGWDLIRLPRLSVMPVSPEQWRRLEELGETA